MKELNEKARRIQKELREASIMPFERILNYIELDLPFDKESIDQLLEILIDIAKPIICKLSVTSNIFTTSIDQILLFTDSIPNCMYLINIFYILPMVDFSRHPRKAPIIHHAFSNNILLPKHIFTFIISVITELMSRLIKPLEKMIQLRMGILILSFKDPPKWNISAIPFVGRRIGPNVSAHNACCR
jgi:hypothetical protein